MSPRSRRIWPQVISRINFARGRILPLLAVNASLGADVYKSDRVTMRFQADGDNLNDRLNIIDFGGLFSGNAIAPGRSSLCASQLTSKT